MSHLYRQALVRPTVTALLSGILLWAGFLIYGSTGHDDSHINFWNVKTLITQGEMVNYNGERVQQTTSLLQDLLTAALAWFSPDHLVTLGYLVDIVSAFACCALGTSTARQLAPSLANWLPLLLLSSGSFMLWTFGGMGAPLTAFCLLLGIRCWTNWLASTRRLQANLLLVGITLTLVLVRPEMPLVIVGIAIALLAVNWRQQELRKRCFMLLAVTLVASASLFIWQQLYFGSWLPVPAIAKQGGDFFARLSRGTVYLALVSILNPILPLALITASISGWRWIRPAGKKPSLLFLTTLCSFLVYAGFVWTAGGDWMQAGRFAVPLIIPACLLLLNGLSRIRNPIHSHILVAALICIQSGLQYPIVATTSHGIPVWVKRQIQDSHIERYGVFEQLNQEHLRDMATIDHLAEIIPPLHAKLGRPVLLMSGQAGMVFYYTASRFYGRVVFRDLRGLVESSLTLCPLLEHTPRSPQGLDWGYRDFFQKRDALQNTCNIQSPDIIYDLNGMDRTLGKTLEPLGYTMIHQETGFPVTNSTSLPYNRLYAPNMIFVRNDLLPLIGNPARRIIDYRQLPSQSRWPMTLLDAK